MDWTIEQLDSKKVKIYWDRSGDVLSSDSSYTYWETVEGVDDEGNEYEACGLIDCDAVQKVEDLEKIIL